MHTLSVTAALVLSTIAGTLATSAVLQQEPAAGVPRESPPQSALTCEEESAQVYIDLMGEPVVVGCLAPQRDPPDYIRKFSDP